MSESESSPQTNAIVAMSTGLVGTVVPIGLVWGLYGFAAMILTGVAVASINLFLVGIFALNEIGIQRARPPARHRGPRE